MSRNFDGANDYLVRSGAQNGTNAFYLGNSVTVFTINAWFRTTQTSGHIFSWGKHDGFGAKGTTSMYLSGSNVWGETTSTATLKTVTTTTSISSNVWHMATYRQTASNNRKVFLDAGGAATDTGTVAGANYHRAWIGVDYNVGSGAYFTGEIAEVSVWLGRGLSDSEIAGLYTGRAQALRQGDSLRYYSPFLGVSNDPLWGNQQSKVVPLSFSEGGGSSTSHSSEHPAIAFPLSRFPAYDPVPITRRIVAVSGSSLDERIGVTA